MEARKKDVPFLWRISPNRAMKQASEMKNYGKENMYFMPRDAHAGSWMQNIKTRLK